MNPAIDPLDSLIERFKNVLEMLPIGAALAHDPDALVITMNSVARRAFDVSPGQNVSISVPLHARAARSRHFIDGREIDIDEAPLQRAIAENASVGPLTLTIERWDGHMITCRVIATPVHDAAGNVAGGIALLLDLERPAADAGSSEGFSWRNDFYEVAESLPQIVWRISADGMNRYSNMRWWEYSGLSAVESADLGWSGALHPEERERVIAAWERAFATGARYEDEHRLRGRDGTYRRFLSRANPVCNEAGMIASWVGTTIDVEDYRQNEAALEFVSESGVMLSASLDVRETLNALLALIVPRFGDCAWVSLVERRALRIAAMLHRDPERANSAMALVGTFAYLDDGFGSSKVLRENEPLIVPEITDEIVAQAIRPEFRERFADLGLASGCVIPVRVDGAVIGTISITSHVPRDYSAFDMPLLEQVGVRAALAIGNARLYEREHRVAVLLQSAQTPATLPSVPGVSLHATYVPASDDAKIGGDWYDAFVLPDGRLVITIGDVTGHGLGSIATMGAMRRSLRGIATVIQDPSMMLDAADRTLRLDGEDGLVTACVAVLDLATGELRYASAGHPSPLCRTAGGRVVPLYQPDLPLGLRAAPSVPSSRMIVEPGSTLVFYTDGLIEAERDTIAAERRLTDVLAGADVTGDLAARLFETMLPNGTGDDVAILTVAFENEGRRKP